MKPIIVTSKDDIKNLDYGDVYFCTRSGSKNTKKCVDDLRKEGYIISAIWRMDYRDSNKYLIHFHAGDEVRKKVNEATEQQLSDQPETPLVPRGIKKGVSYKSVPDGF